MNTRSHSYHRTTLDDVGSSGIGRKRSYVVDSPERPQNGKQTPAFQRPRRQMTGRVALTASQIHRVSTQDTSEYSQRHCLALTPDPVANPLLSLAHPAYGLPEELVRNLASLAIRSIYPWQQDCLLRSGAMSGANLVYTAPTGGGKSLVADIVMLKKILEHPGKKALVVLPYVALVQEKTRWLRQVVQGLLKSSVNDVSKPPMFRARGDEALVKVMGFYGGSTSRASWNDMDIAVCTIEKVEHPVP